MRIIMLGAPGAGKGTQAIKIAEKTNVPHISTGDIFRYNIKNKTELGLKAKEYINDGELVPDELTIGIIKDRILQEDCKNGFVLDGFPRTINQAEQLEKMLTAMELEIDRVLNIDVDDEKIIERLSGRRVCPNCGSGYHIKYDMPEKEGLCNSCNVELVQRDDDNEDTVLARLKTYHKQTEPLIEYYGKQDKLLEVKGRATIAETTSEVFRILGVD